VVQGVEYFRHLAVVDTVGVLAEGGMGVFVLKGSGIQLLLAASSLVTLVSGLRSRRKEGVIIEVPHRWGEVEPRGLSKLVSRAGLIGERQVGSCVLLCPTLAPFMLSRG
jgi:hypothetical protein